MTANPARTLRCALAAALALPGIVPSAAAEAPPETRLVTLRYLDYRDWQPGARRMQVESPSVHLRLPLAEIYVLEGAIVHDAMSGASPLWHDTLSGASGLGVTDHRTAADAKLRRCDGGGNIAIGVAGSSERDYRSQALSFEGSPGLSPLSARWISVGITRELWGPRRVAAPARRPPRYAAAVALICSDQVEFDDRSVRLPRPGMEVDFGGIGKEYAAGRAATICLDAGVVHGLANLGGDVRVIGPRPDGAC